VKVTRMVSSVSCAPDHPDLVVTLTSGAPQTRYLDRLQGLSPAPPFNAYQTQCIFTLERAVKERILNVKVDGLFRSPPQPSSRQAFFDLLAPFWNQFKSLTRYSKPMTQKQFCASYWSRKRVVYEKATESLRTKPVQMKDSYLSSFVKVEKSNKADPVPRVINPRHPRYHVENGRYVKPVEKKIYKAIGVVFGSPTVFKGLNASDRGRTLRQKWDNIVDPVALLLDASRFDQHVSFFALMWEHMCYQAYYPGDKFFAMLLSWQRVNKGFGYCKNGHLKFKCRGCRMSGDMNTALGNCLLMCAMIYSFMHSIGVKCFELANDGDDCVLIIGKRDLHKVERALQGWFLAAGFTMKMGEPVYEFEKIEFCQSQPVWTPSGYVMVRCVPICISKDCVSIKPLNSKKLFESWCAAVGEGGLALAGQIPVLQDFYHSVFLSSNGTKAMKHDPTMETGLVMLSKGMKRSYGDIHPRTRYSFWKAFNIEPARQRMLEREYQKRVVAYDPQAPSLLPPFKFI